AGRSGDCPSLYFVDNFVFAFPLGENFLHGKILACGNIMICSGWFSITAGHAMIAPVPERCQCLGHKLGLICALTDPDFRCLRQKSCTSNPSFTNCFGFCAATRTFVISMSTA